MKDAKNDLSSYMNSADAGKNTKKNVVAFCGNMESKGKIGACYGHPIDEIMDRTEVKTDL